MSYLVLRHVVVVVAFDWRSEVHCKIDTNNNCPSRDLSHILPDVAVDGMDRSRDLVVINLEYERT